MRMKRIAAVLRISPIIAVAMVTAAAAAAGDEARSKKGVPSNVGFFHFEAYAALGIKEKKLVSVRTSVVWGDFEPAPDGRFVTDQRNKQARIIEDLVNAGYRVIPSIRAKSGWAVVQAKEGCSSAPRDLDMQSPLKDGRIYSKSYYDFVKRIAQYYYGQFEIAVIENEMNDGADMWCSSTEAYLRLFLTAKRAFRDVDAEVKIADGGIQGYVLNWMIIKDYIDRGDKAGALDFYRRGYGADYPGTNLKAEADAKISREPFKRAAELLRSRLFQWADAANFHYYEGAEALPDVIRYLRSKVPAGKPILSNEIGAGSMIAADADEAARELVRKFAYLLFKNIKPVCWFTGTGDLDRNAGAFLDADGGIVPETTGAFEAAARFLGGPLRSAQDLSDRYARRYLFRFDDGRVEVLMPKGGSAPVFSGWVPPDCIVYNYKGERVKAKEISESGGPFFMACGPISRLQRDGKV